MKKHEKKSLMRIYIYVNEFHTYFFSVLHRRVDLSNIYVCVCCVFVTYNNNILQERKHMMMEKREPRQTRKKKI